MAEAVAVDRTLPHNLEAERSVLGAVLIHNDAFNQAAEVLTPRDFYRDAHRRIFEKMIQLSERGNAIDFITLKEELSRAGELDEVGGPAYISALVDGLPHAANVEYYARIVREKSTLRNLIFASNKILASAYEAEQEPNLILDEAEQAIFAIAEDRVRAGFTSMRQLAHSSFAAIERAHERKQLITGVPSGFTDLDEIDGGLPVGRSRHHRGAAVGRQDRARPEHRAARRDENRHGRSASSASKCRRNSCSSACSRRKRASTATGFAPDFSSRATGAGCRTRSER